jgi:hypothetical protein
MCSTRSHYSRQRETVKTKGKQHNTRKRKKNENTPTTSIIQHLEFWTHMLYNAYFTDWWPNTQTLHYPRSCCWIVMSLFFFVLFFLLNLGPTTCPNRSIYDGSQATDGIFYFPHSFWRHWSSFALQNDAVLADFWWRNQSCEIRSSSLIVPSPLSPWKKNQRDRLLRKILFIYFFHLCIDVENQCDIWCIAVPYSLLLGHQSPRLSVKFKNGWTVKFAITISATPAYYKSKQPLWYRISSHSVIGPSSDDTLFVYRQYRRDGSHGTWIGKYPDTHVHHPLHFTYIPALWTHLFTCYDRLVQIAIESAMPIRSTFNANYGFEFLFPTC